MYPESERGCADFSAGCLVARRWLEECQLAEPSLVEPLRAPDARADSSRELASCDSPLRNGHHLDAPATLAARARRIRGARPRKYLEGTELAWVTLGQVRHHG